MVCVKDKFGNAICVVRKAGTISLKRFQETYEKKLGVERISRRKLKRASQEFRNIFFITRNPYSRAISSWQRAKHKNHTSFKGDITVDGLDGFKVFMEECQTVYDRHWAPQSDCINSLENDNLILIKLENIEEEIKKIYDKSIVFPHEHSHLSENNKIPITNYRDFLDKEARELIEDVYGDDIVMLGYDY